VLANAAYFAVGPYRCPSVHVTAAAARTNHPPAGAMRGFGANQVCFAYEAQMDHLAAALGIDPVALRLRDALGTGPPAHQRPGDHRQPAHRGGDPLGVRSPPPDEGPGDDALHLPGGVGLTTPPEAVRRGVGFAVGIKNIFFSEAFDDYAEARAVLTPQGLKVHTAASEVGQGMITILEQIARSATGLRRVQVLLDHTGEIGSAGSTSASRQTQMAGGAVLEACTAVRDEALRRGGGDRLDDDGVWLGDTLTTGLERLLADGPIEHLARFRHAPTEKPGPTGQGNVHAGFCVAAHRAVVDVDPELAWCGWCGWTPPRTWAAP